MGHLTIGNCSIAYGSHIICISGTSLHQHRSSMERRHTHAPEFGHSHPWVSSPLCCCPHWNCRPPGFMDESLDWFSIWQFHRLLWNMNHICMIYLSNMVIFSIAMYQKENQCSGVRGDWKGQTWITKGNAVLRSLWRFHLVSLRYTLKAYRSVEGAVLILNYSSSQFPLNTSVQSHCFLDYIPILVLNMNYYWLLLYLQVDIPMAKDWWYWWNVPRKQETSVWPTCAKIYRNHIPKTGKFH